MRQNNIIGNVTILIILVVCVNIPYINYIHSEVLQTPNLQNYGLNLNLRQYELQTYIITILLYNYIITILSLVVITRYFTIYKHFEKYSN